MSKFKNLWNDMESSFWFIPSLIVAVSVAFAVVLIGADSIHGDQWMARWPHLFGSSAAGARGILSTVAGSMMTVVGITFSMTLVTLALASSQYTSLILKNFMRDRVTQVVLGIFAGIFTYCLIALRTVRDASEGGFVPGLAVSFSVVLAIGSISALIFFIHHIASSIQASRIIASVADETMVAIDRLFPENLEKVYLDEDEGHETLPMPERNWQAVPANRNGYIQSVDNEALLRLAREHTTIVRMEQGVGNFVVHNIPLASLSLDAAPNQETIAALQAAFSISRYRTLHQDSAFGIRQIVDMALRALSPGTNDTTTAVMCVDYLTAILARLVSREIPSPFHYEEEELRVIGIGPTFASLAAEAFDQIRVSALGNVAIMLRMIGALQTIASLTTSKNRRKVLCDQAQCIAELARRTIESPQDRARFESRMARVREALEAESALCPEEENTN